MPLPQKPSETGRLFTPRVDRYSQIAVRTNRYSVPTRLIGKRGESSYTPRTWSFTTETSRWPARG
ncbi:hypothetical protein OG873_20000 [Streptomyces violaceus]|uniref:Mu transposase domain-containing protein n=1 Tax=Streptomyces violaceus TaxID=1936 RepID=UPI002E2C5865|nr:hypothetical protein [Streptomyces violaceus]